MYKIRRKAHVYCNIKIFYTESKKKKKIYTCFKYRYIWSKKCYMEISIRYITFIYALYNLVHAVIIRTL